MKLKQIISNYLQSTKNKITGLRDKERLPHSLAKLSINLLHASSASLSALIIVKLNPSEIVFELPKLFLYKNSDTPHEISDINSINSQTDVKVNKLTTKIKVTDEDIYEGLYKIFLIASSAALIPSKKKFAALKNDNKLLKPSNDLFLASTTVLFFNVPLALSAMGVSSIFENLALCKELKAEKFQPETDVERGVKIIQFSQALELARARDFFVMGSFETLSKMLALVNGIPVGTIIENSADAIWTNYMLKKLEEAAKVEKSTSLGRGFDE